MDDSARAIAALNDDFRRAACRAALGEIPTSAVKGLCHATQGVAALLPDVQRGIFEQIRDFDAFTPDNDPYGEHDFGAVECQGERALFKIDYYDKTMDYGSEDPADPEKTTRVLTVMKPSEY